MGTPTRLQVTVEGLYALAERCDTLATELAVTPPSAAAEWGWQTSTKAVNTAHARVGKAVTAVTERVQATGTHLVHAANEYAAGDGSGSVRISDSGGSVLV